MRSRARDSPTSHRRVEKRVLDTFLLNIYRWEGTKAQKTFLYHRNGEMMNRSVILVTKAQPESQ
jgi:hypothetical protein